VVFKIIGTTNNLKKTYNYEFLFCFFRWPCYVPYGAEIPQCEQDDVSHNLSERFVYFFEYPQNCSFLNPTDMYVLEEYTLCDLPKACMDLSIYETYEFKAGYTAALIFLHLQKAGYFQEIYLDPKYFNPNRLISDIKKICLETLRNFETVVNDDGMNIY
jgi:hypothetical protein